MRLELRDGQWAELREHITHGQDKEIQRSYVAARHDPPAVVEVQTTFVRLFVKGWNVLDPDGASIPLDAADAFERMPADLADQIFSKAQDLYKAATVPNPRTPPSSGDSPSAE